MKISVSILGLKDNIDKLINCDIDYLHLDIMDGIFVSNTNEVDYIISSKPLDLHLMVNDVYKYIDKYRKFNPLYITFHYEIGIDVIDVINYIKKFNIKVGLSIKPSTKVEEIIPYLPYLDLILVMSVEPGYGGQAFIMDIVPIYLKAESSFGNNAFKHQFSSFLYHGLKIRTMTGAFLADSDFISIGNMLASNPALTRQLVTLGYDTLEITNSAGKVVKQWQLTTLLALQ